MRNQLVETTARFWSDDELNEIMRLGAMDLWGAILDLHQDHFLTISETATIAANGTTVTDVPTDCFRVQAIEPLSADVDVVFTPRKWKHPDFADARALEAQDPSSGVRIFYQLSGAGTPVGTPTILVAPKLTSAITLRIAYNPTLTWNAAGDNPIPGESDNALKAWTYAYARAKETEDRMPDPAWLAVYKDERTKICTRLTPRQEQEPEVVESFFSGY